MLHLILVTSVIKYSFRITRLKHKPFADMPINVLLTSDLFLPPTDIEQLLNGAEYDMQNCTDRPSRITPSEICITLHITRKLNRPVTVLKFVKNIFPLSIKLAYLHLYSVSVFITFTCFRLRRYAYSSGHDSNSSCHSLSGILAILTKILGSSLAILSSHNSWNLHYLSKDSGRCFFF